MKSLYPSAALLVVLCLFGSVRSSALLSDDELQAIVRQHGGNDIKPLIENEDARLTAPEIIAKYGYPIEIHEIVTEDGYILEVHRIPYGKKSGPGVGKPVVFVQHGLVCDSSNWILNEEHKALAYVLADLGYDVWLGNARGNTYSRKHVSLTTRDDEYWQFSFHEMAKYDIPAVIEYTLRVSGNENLHYVGHSMGTTMFFAGMSLNPHLNSKIRLMTALAPVGYLEHIKSPIRLIAPFLDQIEFLMGVLGIDEFMPSNFIMDLLGATVCSENSPIKDICSNVLFLIAGFNVDQLDPDAVPIILGHTPAGTSTRTVIHLAQLHNSGVFRQYDHGLIKNLLVYGSSKPPTYDFSQVTAPVAVYFGDNDWLADPEDVQRTVDELPNVVRILRVNHPKYNHLDFLWAKDNDVLLNNYVVEYIQNY